MAATAFFRDDKAFEGPFRGVTTTTGDVANSADARELGEYFRGYEARVRFKSTFSAMLAALAGVALGSGPPAGYDPYADVLDHITQGTKVRRRLARMNADEVRVLERLYGSRNATNERPEFGSIAPLIELTTAAQEARDEVVLDESTARSERVTPRVTIALAERRAELEEMFWHEAGVVTELEGKIDRTNALPERVEAAKARVEKLATRIETTSGEAQQRAISYRQKATETLRRLSGKLADSPRRLRNLHRRHVAGRQLLKQLLDGFRYDGAVRATCGAIEATDREITVEDAIRQIMKSKSKRRATFIAAATAQAETMRRAAHAAYKLAKNGDPPASPPRVYVPSYADYRPTVVTHSVSGASP